MTVYQNYTYAGELEAERTVSAMLQQISGELVKTLGESSIRSLVLLGGYGKGEGGLVKTANDGFKPHNNFDLLLVAPNGQRRAIEALNESAEAVLEYLRKDLGMGIDLSIVTEGKLRGMPTRVLWYDMREGHRTIFGDGALVPSIPHTIDKVPAWDMRNLMVNRGTLLLINRLCQMDVGDDINRHEGLKQLMIKHTMKAIIGYGDALLYAQNRYHWSYREKHKRVLHSHGISQAFLDAYDRAMKFRFFPDYEPFENIDIPQWQAQTRRILGDLHLYCESVRLEASDLTWTEYLDRGVASLATERGFSSKTIAKASLNLLKSHTGKLPRDSSLSARLGYHLSGRDEVLPVLFPLLAYCSDEGEQSAEHMAFMQTHFGASADDLRSLISAYLIQWGQAFDPNLRHVLAKNGINL